MKKTRKQILQNFKDRRVRIVKMYDDDDMTFDEIAEIIKLSRPRIIQIYYFEKNQ